MPISDGNSRNHRLDPSVIVNPSTRHCPMKSESSKYEWSLISHMEGGGWRTNLLLLQDDILFAIPECRIARDEA